MIRTALTLFASSLPFAAQAASDLSVLPQGRYECWTAGSASGPAVNPQSEFTVMRGSSYVNEAGRGTYLLASDVLLFTRGPLKDMRFKRSKDGFWQHLASDGALQPLKCSRTGAAPAGDAGEPSSTPSNASRPPEADRD
jgi:hypothetical protein